VDSEGTPATVYSEGTSEGTAATVYSEGTPATVDSEGTSEGTAATIESILKDDPSSTNYGQFYISLRNSITSFNNIVFKKILAKFQLFLKEFDNSIQNQILN
jgi:hypothetical protein